MATETIQLQRLKLVPTRPSTVIAKEFFSGEQGWKTLPRRLQRLCDVLREWECDNDSPELSCAFSLDPAENRRVAMTAAIVAAADHDSPGGSSALGRDVEALLRASLTERDQATADHGGNDTCVTAALSENLRTTGWIRHSRSLWYPQLVAAIQSVVRQKIKDMISGDFETLLYPAILDWMADTVQPWLNEMTTTTAAVAGMSLDGRNELEQSATHKYRDIDLTVTAACAYCQVRMDEIFDLVTSFPDCVPAVYELRDCLDVAGLQSELGTCLRRSLIRRLNHPGATTAQIIDVYICTIKVLRLIDPSDRLLSVVAEPVRMYLRGRSDTVRCIITSLTDAEAGGDLYEELRRQDAKPLENVTVDSDDEEEPPTLDWQPPPSLFKPRGTFLQGSSRNGECDILAMLVSIYGSKELFVNEYRLMLADKLLANLDYNTDKEVHTLELLKLRFGEVSMNSAEVMIKDIEDSVRSNKNIRDSLLTSPPLRLFRRTPGAGPIVDAAMISHIFWPTLQNEQLKHHPRIQVELEEFGDAYAELKNPRKLNWMNQLGTVQLELDVTEQRADGPPVVETKEFSCSPLLATLISHFEDKPVWTAEDLSNETGIPEHVIQKRMAFWLGNRVVVMSGNMEYTLATIDQRQQRDQHLEEDHGDMGQAFLATAQDEEEMEIFESYVSVMLTSLQQAPLEKIHNMLKMMVTGSETKYNKTPQQLSAFLQELCRQDKLECGPDGLYKKLLKKD